MIKVKQIFDAVEPADGHRIWVEPIGLASDLKEWCKVDLVLTHLGPPIQLWEWFNEHLDGYEYFRGCYHEALSKGPYRAALQQLVCAARKEDFTIIHQGDDPQHNTATGAA